MDTLEAGVGGCLLPSIVMGAVAWFLWDSSPTGAQGIAGVAALGFCYGLVCLILARLRHAREEEASEE